MLDFVCTLKTDTNQTTELNYYSRKLKQHYMLSDQYHAPLLQP